MFDSRISRLTTTSPVCNPTLYKHFILLENYSFVHMTNEINMASRNKYFDTSPMLAHNPPSRNI
jgi:hypothetical protein